MTCVGVFVISVVSGCWGVDKLVFPPGFMFGSSTAAAQVEGAWNTSGKSEHIWDRLAHTRPDVVAGGANGDVACDSYHLWRRDIQMMEELGLNMYRFSISWSRILPSGFPNYINAAGAQYYSELIDALLERGIEPVVTIYHFDLPQYLQDLGGWANPLIVDWFADYARVVFSLYADRVKFWLTINEPIAVCDMGYSEQHAPYLYDRKIGQFLCNKNLLMAHAKAWRVYDEEFRSKHHGKVSLSTVMNWLTPKTSEDVELTELTIEYWEGRYCHAIFTKAGGWPPRIEKLLAENAKREGYPQPRLPPFTPDEIEFVKGTYDYYGLNHYTTRVIRKAMPGEKIGPWPFYGSDEIGVVMESHHDWNTTDIEWFGVYPEAFRYQLHWLNGSYGPMDILITENGYPTLDAGPNDQGRLEYIKTYLEQVLLAIRDGISVIGYSAWSLMDNFEWMGGYTLISGCWCGDHLVFPPGFMFGASTAAAQVEGAWNTSGKSEHIWDRLAHTRPEVVAGGANADVACDSYHLWRRDIQMMEELGLNMYRFSISWSRVLPSGFSNYINAAGAHYYSELIDALLARGIEPVITIYHFDLPQSLQDLGKVSLAFVMNWIAPKTREDVEVTELTMEYWEGRYSYPIFTEAGGWPPRIEKLLAENAKREGYPQPRLPPFTPEEIELVKGTYDFYALNHYTSRLVRKVRPGEKIRSWPYFGSDEVGMVLERHPDWRTSDFEWFSVNPAGLRNLLNLRNATYGPMDILITENGYPSLDAGLNDQGRLEYIKGYLEQLLLAINDGVRVIGYSAWSLMDNFEWMGGYTVRFGLYAVNFSDPLRPRTPRDSARYYAAVTRSRAIHPTHDTLNYV